MKKLCLLSISLVLGALTLVLPFGNLHAQPALSSPVDMVVLGSDQSEQAHNLKASGSDLVKGLLDQPARRLLPPASPGWEGGQFSVTVKVDPDRQNYLTARFSGDEASEDYLLLFCEGKQVGYRHLGDIDVLALPDEAPRYNGRFYYVTTPLPLNLSRGKTELHLEVRATGPIWGYGDTFEKYQKPMTVPSQGIYRLYTHTDGCFVPPDDERQGQAPPAAKRAEPGPEVLQRVKDRANKTLDDFLKSTRPLNQMQVQYLARAYAVAWTPAYHSPEAVAQVVAGIDDLYRRWQENPDALWHDGASWNPGWFGVGPAGDAVRRLAEPLTPALNETLSGSDKTRRAAWSAMFQASRDWLREHRLWLTNQAMLTDVNLYLSHRAVAVLDPPHALLEAKALDYLYQSTGIVPWLGKDTPDGPEKLFGDAFYQVTTKGLTRERGYAGGYGEGGVEGALDIYEATRGPDGEGDPRLKAQLIKMIRARLPFRYPMLDAEAHPAMRLETAVGWRDTHLPGEIVYTERGTGEHTPLRIAAATLDPALVGAAQQMFADNQFFAAIAEQLKDNRFRAMVGMLDLPDQYELLTAQPAGKSRLPMSWDQPDGAFADEEAGVVAIKNGREIFYASLYWRAGYAINSLARVHYLTPAYQQTAVVHEDVKFEPSGRTYKRPDWINFGFGNGGTNIPYPTDVHQAFAGEELPIAKIPPDVKIKPGDENHYAGKADFYVLRYGAYLIAMNTTPDKSFDFVVPPELKGLRELITKRPDIAPGSPQKIGPKSTLIFHFDQP